MPAIRPTTRPVPPPSAPSVRSAPAAVLSPPPPPPRLRHPGTTSERSEGRRIRDPCLAEHARDPVHDEAPAARSPPRAPHPPASPPPLRRRFATPPPPPLRGVEDSPPQAPTPILQPHEVGGRCRAKRGGGGDPDGPVRDGGRSARRTWPGRPSRSRASTARGSNPSRAPHLRHPGTASKRSAGRRIRDPCLAAHPRDPVHDEARTVAATSCAAPPPSSLRDATSAPTAWGGGSPPQAPPPILQPHEVGGRCRAKRGGGGDPDGPVRDGRRSARRTWPGRPPPSRPQRPAGPRPPSLSRRLHLRHPGTTSEHSEGRRIRDPCLGAGHRTGRWRRTGASSAPPRLSTTAEAWIPGLRLRFAPASPGMTKVKVAPSPHLRHPGTASERSAGRRIRDPCLAIRPRDPVHDEARAARSPPRAPHPAPPLRRRCATPPPPPLRGVEDGPFQRNQRLAKILSTPLPVHDRLAAAEGGRRWAGRD